MQDDLAGEHKGHDSAQQPLLHSLATGEEHIELILQTEMRSADCQH